MNEILKRRRDIAGECVRVCVKKIKKQGKKTTAIKKNFLIEQELVFRFDM
jgi:hypothetical protein